MIIKQELFQFLQELKENNNKPWFEANRDRYEKDVKGALFDFITAFADQLPTISPHYQAIPRINGGSLFRIHRDLRFSKDKTPYKTAAALHFRHESARDVHSPGFYLHLEPGEVFAGCGIWRPATETANRIRTRIAEHPGEWRAVKDDADFLSTFQLGGESLKRPPRGFEADHPLIEDIKRKDFIGSAELDESDVLQPDFLDQYVDLCRKSTPLMRFLTVAVGLPW